jgi:hypothetical protein
MAISNSVISEADKAMYVRVRFEGNLVDIGEQIMNYLSSSLASSSPSITITIEPIIAAAPSPSASSPSSSSS